MAPMTPVETIEITLKRGDTLQAVVTRAGFSARDGLRIFNAPYNRKLRKVRPDPQALQPGDRLTLPRYAPQHLDAAVLLLTSALVRLDRVARACAETERALAGFSAPRPGKAPNPAGLLKAAQRLEKFASEAGRDCSDGYAALPTKARAPRLEFRPLAHEFSRAARKLDPKAAPGGKEAARALKALGALLLRLQRSHGQVQAEMQRQAAHLRATARAIY